MTALDNDMAAKGWPSVNPNSPDYCYQPCTNGLHVCGIHPDESNFLTVCNLPTATPRAARDLFERARLECAATEGEPCDLVVDLQQRGDCSEDFPMTRQMLDRLRALARPLNTHAVLLPTEATR